MKDSVHVFDYDGPAELFPTRSRKGNRLMAYRRFSKAAEAIRFAVEDWRRSSSSVRALKSKKKGSTAREYAAVRSC